MKKTTKRIIAALLVCLCLAGGQAALAAADYAGHWAAAEIAAVHNYGWMVGNPAGNQRPEENITRADFCVAVWRMVLNEEHPTSASVFPDVKSTDYFHDAVVALYNHRLVTGYSNGKFGPNDKITREAGFTILARAWDFLPEGETSAKFKGFSDSGKVSDWAKGSVMALVDLDYVSGVAGGKLAPQEQLTRAQSAKLLLTVYEGEETPPFISLTYSLSAKADKATVKVVATDKNGVIYIGSRESSTSETHTNTVGFNDITEDKQFDVTANGWYAVCAVDGNDNFFYKLIEVKGIIPPPGPVASLDIENSKTT